MLVWCILCATIIPLKTKENMTEELKKLYALLDKVRTLILGSDPQSRKEYLYLKQQIIEKIKSVETELKLNKKNGILSQ